MAARVQLAEIVDAMEMHSDEYTSYLDVERGEVVSVSESLLNQAEDGVEAPRLPEWQKEEWECAKRMAAGAAFLAFPTEFEIHEWEIMRNFASSVEPESVRDDLLNAIHGAGAFRRFKDSLHHHGIQSAWYEFRGEALRQIALDWCEEHQIAWE